MANRLETESSGAGVMIGAGFRKLLYYARSGRPYSLCRMPFVGGTEEIVQDGLMAPSFAMSNKYVYFMRIDHALYRQPVGESRIEKLGPLRESPEGAPQRIHSGLAVAPDDTTIVYAVAGASEIDLMLLPNLR